MSKRHSKIIGLFCKRALLKRLYSAKKTYNFKEPTDRSHPIYIYISTYIWTCTLTSQGTRRRRCIETVRLILHWAQFCSTTFQVYTFWNKLRLLFVHQQFPTKFTTRYPWSVWILYKNHLGLCQHFYANRCRVNMHISPHWNTSISSLPPSV